MKTQIPIYRAKKIDSDAKVEGFYRYQNVTTQRVLTRYGERDESVECDWHLITLKDGSSRQIDPSTLAISFDNGETWYDDFQLLYETLGQHYPKGI